MSAEPERSSASYSSKVSFDNFLAHLHERPPMPSRIDKGVMGHLNHGTKQALVITLRHLKLITADNAPTPLLERLVNATPEQRKELYGPMLRDSYSFLFDGTIDLKRATAHEFAEKFRDATGASGSTIDKSILLFLGLAAEAGMELSPHLGVRKTSAPNGAKRARGRRPKAQQANSPKANGTGVQNEQEIQTGDITSRLLSKFPTFDPAWPDGLKKQWFEGFEGLMKSAGVKKD